MKTRKKRRQPKKPGKFQRAAIRIRDHLTEILNGYIRELETEPVEEFVQESGNMIKPKKSSKKRNNAAPSPKKKLEGEPA